MVTASEKNNKICIVVTLNDGNDFNNHKNLCENVFSDYDRVQLLNKDTIVIDVENPEKYYIKENRYALLTKEEQNNIKINYHIETGSKEDEVGLVEVYLDNELLITEKIYQKEETKPSQEGFFKKFLRWLFRW
mgnify:CR=1 FL=1